MHIFSWAAMTRRHRGRQLQCKTIRNSRPECVLAPQIRETETTVVLLLGAMTNFITKRPRGPEDRDHPLKKVIIVPLSEDAPAFAARFGVETYTLYNMTEISTPLVSELNPSKVGSCGRARAGVELRLIDENDCEVAQGSVGELIVRSDAPWALNG